MYHDSLSSFSKEIKNRTRKKQNIVATIPETIATEPLLIAAFTF
jgi:hypothetical protein